MNRETVRQMFEEHLKLSIGAPHTNASGTIIFTHHKRIVFGERGPYVELLRPLLLCDAVTKKGEEWRQRSRRAFYEWLETNDACRTKIYLQARKVPYADYVPGRLYVDPRDLYVEGEPVIDRPDLFSRLLG